VRTTKHRLMARILVASLCIFAAIAMSAAAQTTAPNEWTWLGGAQTVTSQYGQPGVYGTPGTHAVGNTPGGRDSAATWTDSKGNFWLFGGEGADANGNFGQLNDVWEFNPSTQEWIWMEGSSTVPASCAGSTTVNCGQPGIYGTLGSAAAANIPGGRSGASYWTDSNGNFWLFAGFGFDADQSIGELNDLWEFNPTTKEWTWMGGSNTVGSKGGQPGVYGTLGSAAATNIPGGRYWATSWTDNSGQFWLYGGEGFDAQGNYAHLDDLWKLNPATQEWTWMGGNSSDIPAACAPITVSQQHCGWPAIYGAIGVPALGIGPGSRVGAVGWADSNGGLWLFGGSGTYWDYGCSFCESDEYDLWKFNPSSQQWTWMSGNSVALGDGGIYGTEGVPAIANIPYMRSNAITWSDTSGNFWLFGGAAPLGLCNDVWVYELGSNEWAWMKGSYDPTGDLDCIYTKQIFGALGSPAAANIPSGRIESASWTDTSGNLWLFGGYGLANGGAVEGDLNDLWIYQPAAPAPEQSFEIIASPNPINIDATGTGTPAITTGTTTVSILTADGFNSPVTLTATPGTTNGVTDITGSFSPATVTGAGSSTLTISVTGAAVLIPGENLLTITATSGGTSVSARIVVVVTTANTPTGPMPAPSFSVPAGTYSAPQNVTITDSQLIGYNNAFIYYTTDGSIPTASSLVYITPITIATDTTLKAIAIDPFYDQSAVSSAAYTFVSGTPVFAPGGGTYSSAQTVTLTDSTPGATIYYTTNGTTPTTSSTVYSGAITVSASETIEAIAVASGYPNSAVASAAYTITPSFSITGTAISVAPGANTGSTSTITLTPLNGFTGVISLSCAITPTAASDPATCNIPASVTISGSTAQTATVTVNTTAATSALNQTRELFWPSAGGAALGCILLFCNPARKRRWLSRLGVFVMLFSIAGGVVACGGGGNNGGGGGGGGGGDSGTTPGTYSMTVTGISGGITETGTVTLTVQ